jgi:outer membrane protein assembly complex protein YaeT
MEGPLYHIGDIRFQGNAEFTSADLTARLKIEPESAFQLETIRKSQRTLQDLYRNTGYNDVVILYRTDQSPSRKVVDVAFDIQEGSQRIVQEVQVEGNQITSRGLARSQIALEVGDILSEEKLSQARLNLYDAGAYSYVDIEVTALDPSPQLKPNQIPVRLVARVREIQPWQLKYGVFYDSQRGPGVITDFSNRNMLGNARVLGLQVRSDADLREARMYFSQPVLRRLPIKSLFSAFKNREMETDSKTGLKTITYQKGLSPTFEYHQRKNNVFSLGYSIEITRKFFVDPDQLHPPVLARTAPVTGSFTRDTRDDPLDATKGHFTSHALDWGTASLGSDLHYLKYFGQHYQYLRFGKPSVVPWTQGIRNRIVTTFGARAGFLKGEAGQDFRSENFKTGGGTTVRGFDQDRLGPLDTTNNPTGGDAVLILNTELRFPAYKFIDGVAFVDAGNVYPRLQDFSPFDLRASYGFGLRVRTPYLLLRFDYGIKMKPKPGELRGKYFISIGQAF